MASFKIGDSVCVGIHPTRNYGIVLAEFEDSSKKYYVIKFELFLGPYYEIFESQYLWGQEDDRQLCFDFSGRE